MSVSGISGAASASDLAPSPASTGSTDLGQDAFLRLLTTQLQYQDPLDPMSNEEFVSQLAQFSSLEQLQSLNDGMESLYVVNTSMNNASMVSLIGQDVVAYSDTFHYDGEGDQTIHYSAASAAQESTLTVTDSDGTVVYSADMGMIGEGEGSWTWDGKNQDGQVVDAGDYTFSVTASTLDGEEVTVTPLIAGTINEMDYSTGTPQPKVDGVPVSIGDILRVSTGTSE